MIIVAYAVAGIGLAFFVGFLALMLGQFILAAGFIFAIIGVAMVAGAAGDFFAKELYFSFEAKRKDGVEKVQGRIVAKSMYDAKDTLKKKYRFIYLTEITKTEFDNLSGDKNVN